MREEFKTLLKPESGNWKISIVIVVTGTVMFLAAVFLIFWFCSIFNESEDFWFLMIFWICCVLLCAIEFDMWSYKDRLRHVLEALSE